MIGIYCRISTAGQKDNYSLEVQEQQGIQFAERLGDEYTIYQEQSSGGNIQRIELGNLIRDIERRFIDKVWVIELSRLSRSIEDLQVLKHVFSQYNVDLYIGGQHYDLAKTDQVTMYNLIGVFAEHERAGTRDRMVRGRQADIAKGGRSVSQMFGYKHKYTEDGTSYWQVVESEAEQIRLIFDLYKQGKTQREIQIWLNSHGYRLRSGSLWNRPQISRVLKQILYTGKTTDHEGNIIDSTRYPAIVSYQDYQKVAEIAASRSTHLVERRVGSKKVLYNCSAIVKCKDCGNGYVHKRKPISKGKTEYNHYYYCHHRPECSNVREGFRKRLLDDIVFYLAMDFFDDWKNIESIYTEKIKQLDAEDTELNRSIKLLEKNKRSQEKKRQRLVDAIAAGAIEPSDARPTMERIKADLENIDNRIEELKTKTEAEKQEWDLVLARLSHENRERLNWAYVNGEEHEVNTILNSIIKSAWFYDYVLHFEFITGDTVEIDIDDPPEGLVARINGLEH